MPSDLTAVVGPVQQRLPLAGSARQIAGFAVALDLSDVPSYRLPALDLPAIFLGRPSAHVVAAIPLEPAARIVGMYPSLGTPDLQRMNRIHAQAVQRTAAPSRGQLRMAEPARRKLIARIGHVLAAKYAQPQHLLRRQFR